MASDRCLFLDPRPSSRNSRGDLLRASAARAVEQLESRTFLSVSLAATGFTQVTPSADSRLIYVSSSIGSDSNTGLFPDAPVASIARAYSLLRDNEPDWLLFNRGDTFVGTFSYFDDSGRSPQEPMVVTNYGDPTMPLPVIDAGADTAFRTGKANHDLYIIGLNFTSSTHNPTSPNFTGQGSYGFYDLGGTSDLLIEDCTFSYFVNDITFQGYNGPLSDITIRRNEVLDAYNVGGHSQGLYADSVTNLTIEDNIFDHDGWTDLVPNGGATIYNHDCYLHSSNANCVVTGNTFADAGSFGLEARAGGIVDDNLFVNDPYGFAFGLVNGSTAKAGGVSGEAIGNVVIQPRQDPNGWGIGALIGNLAPGDNTLISDNIFANAPGDTAPAMEFAPGNAVSNPRQEAGLHDVTVSDNTAYGWGFGILMSSKYSATATGADSISGVVISDNNFQNNLTNRIVSHDNAFDPTVETWSGNSYSASSDPFQWFNLQGVRTSFISWQSNVEPTAISQVIAYADPTRTIDTYMMSLDQTGGMSAFIAGVRDLSDTDWNPVYQAGAVINYIQDGFATGDPASSSGSAKAVAPPADAPTSTPTPDPTPIPISPLGPVQAIVPAPTSPVDPAPAPVATPTPAPVTTPDAVDPSLAPRVVLTYANPRHTTITGISLVFPEPVTSDASMLTLAANTAAGTQNVMTFVSNPSGDGRNWVITCLGQTTKTLPTGSYTLTIHTGSILNAAGQTGPGDVATDFTSAPPPKQTRAKDVVTHVKSVKPAKIAHVIQAAKGAALRQLARLALIG